MSVIYRFTIWTDSAREKRVGSASVYEQREYRHDSERARAEVIDAFEVALRNNVPDGGDARAWLEVSNRYWLRVLAKYTLGKVIARSYEGVATHGTWERSDGTIVAQG